MKTQTEIERVLDNLDATKAKYPAMTYEQGIEEALSWVIGDIPDDEFSPITDSD